MRKFGISVLLAFVLAAGCSKGDTTPDPTNPDTPSTPADPENPSDPSDPETPEITISTTDYTLKGAGESVPVTFEVNVDWTASVAAGDAQWLTVSPESGEAGTVTVTLTAGQNPTQEERKTSVQIHYGDEVCTLTVTQAGYDEALQIDITDDFDPQFAQELQTRGYIPDAKHITLGDVKDITELNVAGPDDGYGTLTSLQGISYFASLTELDCSANLLTALDVRANTALKTLYCNLNELTDLDVSKNAKLIDLQCYSTGLTTLDVSANTDLRILDCTFNKLTDLDISHNTALTKLQCYNNRLTTLDVSANTVLSILNCTNNQLTDLDVSYNTALTILICEQNLLTSLDVSQNTALTELWCTSNQLTSLDVSRNTALTELWCDSNQLTELDISNNMALTVLKCNNNPGIGTTFPVTAWFDNKTIPRGQVPGSTASYSFTTGEWEYDGQTVKIDYRKAEE